MNDLIDRQAAIDAIESHIRTAEEPYQLSQTEKVLNHAFEIAASCVYNLPSAQPEIVRCKDCKWFGDIGCAIRIYDNTDKPSKDDYCSFAERKGNG